MDQRYGTRLAVGLIAALTGVGLLLGTHPAQAQTNPRVWALIDSAEIATCLIGKAPPVCAGGAFCFPCCG
ncbi:MAG: hypothetical protein M3Z04_05545 [Chloroflexota bacterium]|nr:hypothetical protein [Chloroflexota bacterium]